MSVDSHTGGRLRGRATPKPNGALPAQQLAQLVQRARQGGYPDAIIGDYRVIAVGDT